MIITITITLMLDTDKDLQMIHSTFSNRKEVVRSVVKNGIGKINV